MSDLKILVVGASVAGPMAAYWLARAGAKITVIERYPELRTGGQNIDIRTTGVTIMRKIPGMESAVRANLAPVEAWAFVRSDNSIIAEMRSTGNPDQQSLVSEYEIYRGQLSRILYDYTKDHDRVKYIFDEQISSIQQPADGSPVTVSFANGTPAQEFDLVVACDGATSRTRSIGLECGVGDYIKPIGAWVAYWSIKKDLLNGNKTANGISAPGGRTITLATDPKEGVNRCMAWSSHWSLDDPVLKEFRTVQKNTDDLKAFVKKRFTGMGWKSEEMLAGIDEAEDFYASEWCQVKPPSLSNGRFVLVGDAGYASGPSGAGTSLAMTGAYILAGEINDNPTDVTAALQGYEERMRPIIKDMQVVPPGVLTIMAPQTAWGISIRNTIFQAVCFISKFSGIFWWATGFWSSGLGKDKYGIKDYNWVA